MSLFRQRRRFLLGTVAVGAAAGLLIPLSRAGLARMALLGQREGAKLKVVFYVIPDGLGVDEFSVSGEWNGRGIWHPNAKGATDTDDFELNEASDVLEKHRAQTLYLRGGILMNGGSPFVGHSSWTSILRNTGAGETAGQTSIDNWLGEALVGTNPSYRVIYAGPHTRVGGGGNPFFYSFNGTTRLTPEKHPGVLFDRLFGAATQRGNAKRSAHVFDPVMEDIKEIRDQVTGAERAKLDLHLASVEQVAKDIGGITEPNPECDPSKPTFPELVDAAEHRNAVHAAHHQVVATALSCGISRVATIQVGYSTEQLNILEVSTKKNPHDLAHWGVFGGVIGAPEDKKQWLDRSRWYANKFGEFLDELAKHPDPDVPGENLLKNTLVVFLSEMADGAPEHNMDMPLIMAGGATGLLMKGNGQGRFLHIGGQGDVEFGYPGRPPKSVSMQRIWATIACAAGAPEVPYAGNISSVTGIFNNVT